MSEKQTSPREVEPTAAKSTTREEEPTTVKATPPPPKPDEESTAVKRALLFMYWVAALLGSDYRTGLPGRAALAPTQDLPLALSLPGMMRRPAERP